MFRNGQLKTGVTTSLFMTLIILVLVIRTYYTIGNRIMREPLPVLCVCTLYRQWAANGLMDEMSAMKTEDILRVHVL